MAVIIPVPIPVHEKTEAEAYQEYKCDKYCDQGASNAYLFGTFVALIAAGFILCIALVIQSIMNRRAEKEIEIKKKEIEIKKKDVVIEIYKEIEHDIHMIGYSKDADAKKHSNEIQKYFDENM